MYSVSDNTIVTDEENIALQREYARKLINTSRLPDILEEVDPAPYALSQESTGLLEIIEITLALSQALVPLYEEYAEIDEDDEPPFIETLLSLHQASWYAAKKLDVLSEFTVRTVNTFRLDETINLLSRTNKTDSFILKDLITYIKKHASDSVSEIIETACAYFHIMHKTIALIAKDTRYVSASRKLSEYKYKVLDFNFDFLKSPEAITEEKPSYNIDLNDIIGNREYINAGKKLVRNLLAFDPSEKQNPRSFNQVLFGMGRPGSGKTATAHALGNYLLKRASEINLDAKFVVIRRTDWASAYQNESAFALLERFKSQLQDYNGVVMFYWPDIDTAFSSRTSESGSASEEKAILGAAFGLFDGTVLPMNGQWLLICDANYMQMDEAVISRLSQEPYKVNGPETADDYVKLLKDVLLGEEYAGSLEISQDEWQKIGEKAVKLNFSGRDLSHLAKRLTDKMEDFDYEPDFFEKDFKARKIYIKNRRNKIDSEFIIGEFDRINEFKLEAERLEADERIKNMVKSLNLESRALLKFEEQTRNV